MFWVEGYYLNSGKAAGKSNGTLHGNQGSIVIIWDIGHFRGVS